MIQTDPLFLVDDLRDIKVYKKFGSEALSDSQKARVTKKTFSRLLKTLSIGIKIIAIAFSLIIVCYESSYKSPDNYCYAASGDVFPVQKITKADDQSYAYFKGS